MRKQQIAIITFFSWLTLISLIMLVAQNVDLKIFFVTGFMGFLIITELMRTKYVKPSYIRFIWYLIAAGIVIFSVIVIQQIRGILF
jgi:hypothetical protein